MCEMCQAMGAAAALLSAAQYTKQIEPNMLDHITLIESVRNASKCHIEPPPARGPKIEIRTLRCERPNVHLSFTYSTTRTAEYKGILSFHALTPRGLLPSAASINFAQALISPTVIDLMTIVDDSSSIRNCSFHSPGSNIHVVSSRLRAVQKFGGRTYRSYERTYRKRTEKVISF